MKLLLLSLITYFVGLPAIKESVSAKIKTTCENSPLLDRKWEMQEIRFLYDNDRYYYQRDNYAESNMNFDNDYIIFNCEGTGIYHQGNNIDYKIQWHFIESKKNAIEFTISKFRNNSDLVVNWENIDQSSNQIKYTEYYSHKNGLHCLGYGIRMSKDPEIKSAYITSR